MYLNLRRPLKYLNDKVSDMLLHAKAFKVLASFTRNGEEKIRTENSLKLLDRFVHSRYFLRHPEHHLHHPHRILGFEVQIFQLMALTALVI